MSVKQKLEDHVVIVVLTVAVSAFAMGWGACEFVRVANKTERISELEKKVADNNVAIEPYQKRIAELVSNMQRLETDLNTSRGDLAQWQQALQSWKNANTELQRDLNLYTSNCGVISLVRAVEGKKESVERTLANAYQWGSETPKIEDYKRQVAEYQSRLMSLQEKLSCVAK